MNNTASDLADRLAQIIRDGRGRLVAALVRSLGDFDLTEDALGDATERALEQWESKGIPENPQGWLLDVARRCAIDRIQKGQDSAAREPVLDQLKAEDEAARAAPTEDIPDDRLRLIFACCHPSLEENSRVALTLRMVVGLTTGEIARAFHETEEVIVHRLARAKTKIVEDGFPFEVPVQKEWSGRVDSVLAVVYLIFNEGWLADASEDPIRDALCDEALFLARLLTDLAPGDAETEGLLALILLILSRRTARHSSTGALVPLEKQDRSLWDRGVIDLGLATLNGAIVRGAPGPFQCQAAIQAVHVQSESADQTDWRQIVLLYERLLMFHISPVIQLNRAIALMEAGLDELAQSEMQALETSLADYQPFHAAFAEANVRTGDVERAKVAYDKAIMMSQNDDERAWLSERRDALG